MVRVICRRACSGGRRPAVAPSAPWGGLCPSPALARALARAVGLGGLLLIGTMTVACSGEEPSPAGVRSAPPPAADRQIDPPAAVGSLAPNLAPVGDGLVLSWLEPLAGGGHRLVVSLLEGDGWGRPVVVAEGDRFFANWADLPAVAESGDGSLIAHWLAKTAEQTYAYSIFLARSRDGGASWTPLGRLDDDDTPTEHGFVSWVPEGPALRAFWLDGRETAGGGAMALRTALVGETIGASELVDPRVCDCCSTDAAAAASGAVAVYRDRTDDERRDISVVRRRSDDWRDPGSISANDWSDSAPVAADGWIIAGCPVNGPAVSAAGRTAAAAWFTAAGDAPRVQVAFSTDGAATFGLPKVIDPAAPLGRVDVELDAGGGAIVSWLAAAGATGSVRLRRALPDGSLGEPLEIATTGASRASGFPRLARRGDTLYLAWVDTTPEDGHHIRARAIPLDRLPAPS